MMRPPRRPDKVEAFERRLVEYWFDFNEHSVARCNNVEIELCLYKTRTDGKPWAVTTKGRTLNGFWGCSGMSLAEKPTDEEFVDLTHKILTQLLLKGDLN